MTQNTETRKENNDKFDIKNYTWTIIKLRDKKLGKIFATHIPGKGLKSLLYKDWGTRS